MASAGMPPARSRTGPSSKPTMVLSRPTGQGPASITASIRPERPLRTCAAVVGEILPDGLAEGAAMGVLAACRSAVAVGLEGTRTARFAPPAVTSFEIGAPGFSGKTSVSAPGQKADASRRASSLKSQSASAA